MSASGPIDTLPLYPEISAALLELLGRLPDAAWRLPTVHADRSVRDLVAHLLDGATRRLAAQRDGWAPEPPAIAGPADLVAYVQRINREFIVGTARLSPRMLLELLRKFEAEVAELLAARDPAGPAMWPVDWAGERASQHWFDVARDYTERWHHQQQIRDAVGAPGLQDRKYMHPALDTFMRALPHAYRDAPADAGTVVRVVVEGEAGGIWELRRAADRWTLAEPGEGPADATARVDQDSAWRIFTRGLPPAVARGRVRGEGPAALVDPLAAMVCVML